MRPVTVQLFINPQAGSQSRLRTRQLCSALEALGARTLLAESPAGQLMVDDSADYVCAVGGDGTLRHVVDAVRRTGRSVPICAYPAGTVNLLAMECAYPRSTRKFAERLLEGGKRRQHYLADVVDTPLLICASVGPDSQTIARLSFRLKRLVGRAAYLAAFCQVLLCWRRSKIVLVHDDRRTECEAVYIAKGRYFAGRWSFAPQASLASPLLHVVALRRASRFRFALFAWAMIRCRSVELLRGVEAFTCTTLTMLSEDALPLQTDGDIVTHLPAFITIQPEPFSFV